MAVETIAGFNVAQINDILMIGVFSSIGFGIRLIKKFISEGLHPWEYIKSYRVRTFSSWVTITGASVTAYIASGDMNALTYITLAYMADSLVNKAPTQQEMDDYRAGVAEDKETAAQAKIAEQLAKESNIGGEPH